MSKIVMEACIIACWAKGMRLRQTQSLRQSHGSGLMTENPSSAETWQRILSEATK
jgi:hypothetical protein